MNTRGPEISFLTSRRRFPQKEQWKSSIAVQYCTGTAQRQAVDGGFLGKHAPPSLWRRARLIFSIFGRCCGHLRRGIV
jgi:hypothetical protein